MAVELRRVLKDSGVGNLHTEDWIDVETAFRSTVRKPFPDFAELFGLGEKIGILRRAWGRWGWRGVRTVVQREIEVHRLLTRERILGLNLLLGTKGEDPGQGEETGDQALDGDLQTTGLPLFGPEGDQGA
jgi:hypothetical protein